MVLDILRTQVGTRLSAARAHRLDVDIWSLKAGPGRCARPECSRRKPLHRRHNELRYTRSAWCTRAVAGEAGVYGGVRFVQAGGGIGLSTSQPVTFGIIA